ncbi:MAG: Asr1405/Asl0597 family protein [Cyanobacteria bacterium J06635_10]
MLPPPSSNVLHQIVQIPYFLRWQIYHRLQELEIPCYCREDGSLQVQLNSWIAAILLRSIVIQFTASRLSLIDWLERCWQL